ncbi:MAG: hypothetical protein NC417_02435 [Candidatus Gastranaerophilales bacterium]|nr:hypothetical protein [Candidatus Gastranaerophilales bacterium]
MTEEGYSLKIDPEFRRLVFPYSQEECEVLEQQILQSGCCQPIVVWYGYIIQGFEQYNICMAHGIGFKMKNISFRVREEVISLVCQNELSVRYLPENQRRYLIGKRYNADIIVGAHNAAGTDRFKERARRDLPKGRKFYESSAAQTKERIAEEYHLNQYSVTRYSIYAQAIDYIAYIQPETVNQILAGKVKISMEDVMVCYGKTEGEVTKLLSASRKSVNVKRTVDATKETVGAISIKDMPAFDPDAEINSLALTIPSWVSFIDRTRVAAKFALLTSKGRKQLEQELYRLEKAIQTMFSALKEVH